ncbi:MAG: Co2+/Mg2+ efflux protein ApaG [Gammaproteobacteria bacterium RBG_16_51_14]|nr:MAG: Co2+/Mg2+ efflux protein ApaG [Gammaproteobacteria bacterium RBG_16_51_14]
MTERQNYDIRVRAEVTYVREQSLPDENRYVFAYTITITNNGSIAAALRSRHWVITDANGKVQEVRGEGVVGEQPHLLPGKSYRYSSAAMIETPVGCMEGSYLMMADDGVVFEATIPAFNLSTPHTLH